MIAVENSKSGVSVGGQADVSFIPGKPGKTASFNALLVWVAFAIVVLAGVVAGEQAPVGDQFAPRPSGLLNWDWWRAPLETNAFRRQIGLRIDTTLTAVHFHANGNIGWAAGGGGVIVSTANGGKTWRPQASNTQASLWAMTFLADGQQGWVVGDAGVIVTTADGGKTWRPQASNTQASLRAVTFLADGQRGWAVGLDGVIRATADGGKTWQPQISNTRAGLLSIIFLVDGLRGWASGFGGVILATVDGGKTWQPQASNTMEPLNSIAFLADGLRGWAAGDGGAILATADGGKTWQPRRSNTQARLLSVGFLADGQRGWAAGTGGVILVTADGGNTWQPQLSNAKADLQSVAFLADGLRGWAAGDDGVILATTDGGKTWWPQISNMQAWLWPIAFLADGQRGWAAGRGGVILATTDSGKTWLPQASNTQAWLLSIAFLADGQRGWAVGSSGAILVTVDGGKTWQPQISNTRAWLQSIAFLADGQRGWAAGNDGMIVATADGGKTWQLQASNTNVLLSSIAFLGDGLRGWAAGSNGTILVTADGGKTWRPQASNTMALFSSIAFQADGQRGWVTGDDGAILATSDGGRIWLPQASSTKAGLQSIAFLADGQRGWAAGSGGAILATADGGKAWQPQASSTKAGLQSIAFLADGQSGWVVGNRGVILSTADGGKTWNQPAQYRRWPAPWFWAMLAGVSVVAPGIAWRRMRRNHPIEHKERILARAVEDGPVTDADRDRLGFGPIVEALADFMRHEGTRPPVTFAITAPWGRGKSSLMRLLEQRLKGTGVRTVWFNAWHYQREPVMLAALLEMIAKQAIPSWWSIDGLHFRWQLFFRRLRRERFLGLGPLAIACSLVFTIFPTIVSLLVSLFTSHDVGFVDPTIAAWMQLIHALVKDNLTSAASDKLFAGDWAGFFKNSLGAYGSNPAELWTLGIWLYAAVSLWFLVFRFLRPFPASPAALLASLGNKLNVRQAEEQTGFRQRFREHFGDVCAALRPGTLTIFVDDLDRCDAAKAAEMLEAVNYLGDAGECFVVMGMAKGIVDAQLGDNYKDIAERHAAFAALDRKAEKTAAGRLAYRKAATPNGNGEKMRVEADRRDYARNYLRKLIQIEVPVPQFSSDELKALLADEGDEMAKPALGVRLSNGWCKHGHAVGDWLQYGLVVLVLILALTHGYRWSEQAGAKAKEQTEKESAQRRSIVEERRVAALQAGAYRAWLKEQPVTAGAAAAKESGAPAASAAVRRQARIQDVDERWRRLEADIDFMERYARADAEKDFKRADEEATRSLATFTKLAADDNWLGAQSNGEKPQSGRGDARAPVGDAMRTTASDGRPFVEPPDPDAAPAWPYWLVYGVLLLPGLWLIYRSYDRYKIRESDDYKRALAAWRPVLLAHAHMQAPREAKRFLNLSRYLTLRINAAEYARPSWIANLLDRQPFGAPRKDAKKVVDEKIIVGMTSLYLARPAPRPKDFDLKRYLVAPEATLSHGADEYRSLLDAIAAAQSALAGTFNPTHADAELFLHVVGEMES